MHTLKKSLLKKGKKVSESIISPIFSSLKKYNFLILMTAGVFSSNLAHANTTTHNTSDTRQELSKTMDFIKNRNIPIEYMKNSPKCQILAKENTNIVCIGENSENTQNNQNEILTSSTSANTQAKNLSDTNTINNIPSNNEVKNIEAKNISSNNEINDISDNKISNISQKGVGENIKNKEIKKPINDSLMSSKVKFIPKIDKNQADIQVQHASETNQSYVGMRQDFISPNSMINAGIAQVLNPKIGIKLDGKLGTSLQKATGTVVLKDSFGNDISLSGDFLRKKTIFNFNGNNNDSYINQVTFGGEYSIINPTGIMNETKLKVFNVSSSGDSFGAYTNGNNTYDYGVKKANAYGAGLETNLRITENTALKLGTGGENVTFSSPYTPNETKNSLYYNAGIVSQITPQNQISLSARGNSFSNSQKLEYTGSVGKNMSISTGVERTQYNDSHINTVHRAYLEFKYLFGNGVSNILPSLFKTQKNTLTANSMQHITETNAIDIRNLRTYEVKREIITPVPPTPPIDIINDKTLNGLDLITSSDSGSNTTDNITNVKTPTFTWNALSLAESYEISFDNGTTWRDVGNVTSYTSPTLADGTYQVKVRGVKASQGTSNASSALEIKIDTVKATSFTFIGTTPDTQNTNYTNLTLQLDHSIAGGTIDSITSSGDANAIGTSSIDSNGNILLNSYRTPSDTHDLITVTVTTASGNQSTFNLGFPLN